MDIPQLKLLAARLRELLRQSSSNVGHSQALDLIAAVPGLRNWPEVMAFPARVASAELDAAAAARLAFRLNKAFSLELRPKDLVAELAREQMVASQPLQVWPGGPPAGVYVTTSEGAIEALLARYEEATDGGLVYTEGAGQTWPGSIDIGDYGLWSKGIERLPSGTLFVVGPLELNQSAWDDAAQHAEIACWHAIDSRHRVAVLVRTPMPQLVCQDVALLVRSRTPEGSGAVAALTGIVSDDGQLVAQPFPVQYPAPISVGVHASVDALPISSRDVLSRELPKQSAGIVLFGAWGQRSETHAAIDQVAAALSLTEHVGPAARVMPRFRSTPEKDWLVPDAIKALPFLPSIDSARAQGYRRIVIDAHYAREALDRFEDLLVLGYTHFHSVEDLATYTLTSRTELDIPNLQRVVALLGMLKVEAKRGEVIASDLYVRGNVLGPIGTTYDEVAAYLRVSRTVRWEEELEALFDSGAVTIAAVKRACRRDADVVKRLERRSKMRELPHKKRRSSNDASSNQTV